MMELNTPVNRFVPGAATEKNIDPRTRQLWQRRCKAAVQRIEQVGIKTTAAGFERHYSLRTDWDAYITSLAPTFSYELDAVDTALARVK